MGPRRWQRSEIQLFPLLLVLSLCASGAVSAATLHVVPVGGAPSGPCDTWANACTLQVALGLAGSGDEVWVKAGVYLPTTDPVPAPSGTDQAKTFEIFPGVAVYGGFAGTESARSERDPQANVTILSGDIDGNDDSNNLDGNSIDESSTAITGSNSCHVVSLDGSGGTPITAATVLDGFVITGGDAESATPGCEPLGGGLRCTGAGAGSRCSPRLSGLVFQGNRAQFGGAMFDDGYSGESSPSLTDVTFRGNRASDYGGAMYNYGETGVSSPVLEQVTFSGNSALDGGAMYNEGLRGESSPSLVNVTLSGNSADLGGALYNDGTSGVSSPSLNQVTFNGNSASFYGGALYNDGRTGGTSSPTLSGVILWGDSAGAGAEVYNDQATPTLAYSVVEGSGGSGVASWDSSLGTDGGGNRDADPVLGPLQNNGGFTETMALGPGSSAIDTGDDGLCTATDQRSVARPQDGDGDGVAHCDVGAYELEFSVLSVPALGRAGLALLALLLAAGALALLRR